MNNRHKHADVIIAWANGETIQVRCPGQQDWLDVTGAPAWCEGREYRVKPVIHKFRLALIKSKCHVYPSIVDSKWGETMCEKEADFVRWLTDWIEYEVEE